MTDVGIIQTDQAVNWLVKKVGRFLKKQVVWLRDAGSLDEQWRRINIVVVIRRQLSGGKKSN